MGKFLKSMPGYSLVEGVVLTATFKQSGVTFLGTVVNGLLGAAFYILLARYLGPSVYGLLSVSILFMTMASDVGDLGTDTGLVRYVGKYFNKQKVTAYKYLKLGLEIKFCLGLFLLAATYTLAPVIALQLFNKPEITGLLRIASFGVLGALLFSYTTHVLQAVQKFYLWSGIQIFTNLIRLLVIVAIVYLSSLTGESVLVTHVLMPFIGFLIGFFIIPRDFLFVRNELSVAGSFFKYNKWVALFTLVAAVSSRLDTFISARFLSSHDLGIYSAANQLVQVVPQIVVAMGTVIAPKMASMGALKEFISYFKKTQIMVLGIAGTGLISIPLVINLIPLVYGREYLVMTNIFIVLLLAMLIFLISVPVHMSIFYYFSHPVLFFYLGIFHFLIILLGGWFLISSYGPMGAALTVLIGQVINFFIPLLWFIRKLKSEKYKARIFS